MGVILKIALRNMKRRKTRYILTTVTLILGVALFGGINIVADSFNGMMLNTIDEQMGTADILVRWDDSDDGWFDPDDIDEILKDVDNVVDISYRITGFNVFVSGTDEGNQAENSTYTGIYGLDIENKAEENLGADPYILDVIDDLADATSIEDLLAHKDEKTGEKVIVIVESLQILLEEDIEAGSRVRIFPNKGSSLGFKEEDTGTWLEYTVTAVIRDNAEAVDFNPETNESRTVSQAGALLFCNINNAHELVDGRENHKGEYNLAVIGLDDIYSVTEAAVKITQELGQLKKGEDWKISDLKTDSLESIEISMQTLRTMFSMFGMIALILSIVLIWNVFNIIREEQEYETGMMQAIGSSRSETFRLFLFQGVVMGLIGSLIGTIASYFISFLVFSVAVSSMQSIAEGAGGMGFAPSDFEIILLPSTLIMTFAVGFVSCLVGSVYPSYKASRKPLIECLNPIEEKSEREKKKYKKRIVYAAIGIFLIYFGVSSIFSTTQEVNGGHGAGPPAGAITGMTAPTFILLGIIVLTALSVRILAKGLVKLFGPYLKQTKLLTEKNILRHRKRTILTYSMIALTVSYLIGMSVMLESMKAGIGTTIDDTIGADIRIFTFGTSRSVQSEIAGIDGVDDVMGVTSKNARVKIQDQWIGHDSFEEEYNTSITVYALDTEVMKEHMTSSSIISPTNTTLEEMLEELDDGTNIVVTEEFAEEYEVKVGDKLPVKLSLGITYASLQKMFEGDDTNAREDTVTRTMKVIAIISKIQGFSTGGGFMGGFGGSSVTMYSIFISWGTYETLALMNLPGEDTDLIFRQETQTGNSLLDSIQSNWFNISGIGVIMNQIENITYYTSRMDYPTMSYDGVYINYQTSVVGIHTEDFNKRLQSDVTFGSNELIDVNDKYTGDTMEELLNISDYVCVVDEIFVANQREDGDPSFDIGSTINLFPLDTKPIPVLLRAGYSVYPPNTTVLLEEGAALSGTTANLTHSDNVNLTCISNDGSLVLNLNMSMPISLLLTKIITPVVLNIETRVNITVQSLELQVFNHYTSQYDILGGIDNTDEYIHNFTFSDAGSYIDFATGVIQLKVVGTNLDNYNLTIDFLSINIIQSEYNTDEPWFWPEFEVIGIIDSPTLYNTERYFWLAGYETGADVSGNAVYINYNKAREVVFKDHKGIDALSDEVTSVLVHCEDPREIESTEEELSRKLRFGSWSIVNLKTFTLEMRTNVFDWYIWIADGANDEDVLDATQEYLQDNGYLVIFGFTKSFIISAFSTMTDLMNFIMSGVLLLAVLISLIGLALHCLLTTMARRREIGMLRSIGLTKKGIVRSISGETLIVASLGVIVGIFAGLIQGVLTVASFPSGGFLTFTLSIPWVTITTLLIITMAAAFASSRYPARWASRLNIIDAVRTR